MWFKINSFRTEDRMIALYEVWYETGGYRGGEDDDVGPLGYDKGFYQQI